MKILALIPARYASTRLPGKPLADLGGKPLIRWVYEGVSDLYQHTYVATDDRRIAGCVESFGGKHVLTGSHHRSGTDRCREALVKVERETGLVFDLVINVQGDEPFVDREQLRQLTTCFSHPATDIATLVIPFGENEDVFDPNSPKVVLSTDGYALYFSRSPIPYVRAEEERVLWNKRHRFLKHIGIYAYRRDVLLEIADLPQGALEKAESLEQLRWLENGYRIRAAVTDKQSVGVDTPEDLEKARALLAGKK